MDPYRTAADVLVDPLMKPNFLVRAWRKLFGQLVYTREKSCHAEELLKRCESRRVTEEVIHHELRR